MPTPHERPPALASSTPFRLPLITKVLFGIGSMADGSQIIIISGVLLLYYSQILHVPVQWVALVLGVSLFVDAFWDLLVAQFSDNLRARLGRRHPLMYASALPAGLSFMALWIPPPHLGQTGLLIWLMVFATLFRFSHSLYMVPSGALLPELAPGYHDRTELFGFRYMLGTIGGVIAAVLTYGVFLHKTPAYPLGQLNPAGYPPMAIAVGLLIITSSLISSVGTHWRIPYLYRPSPRRFGLGEWLREIASIFNNRNFLVVVAAGMLQATALALTSGLAIYFNTFLFALPSSNVMLLAATQALSAPIAFLAATGISRRWGKRRAYMVLYSCSLVFTYGPLVLRLIGVLPPNGSPLLLPVLLGAQVVSGILSTSGLILGTSMITDIVEENQAKTQRRSEGLVLFSDRLMLKLATGMATILPGILLAVVHFPARARPLTLDPAVTRHLALLYLPIAVGFNALAILTWLLFRIDKGVHQRNLDTIAENAQLLE